MGDGLGQGSGQAEDSVTAALEAAETDPNRALTLLEGVGEDASASLRGRAEWARGRARRQLGDHHRATAHLERAVELLGPADLPVLAARASVSLAAERIDEARFDDAIVLLDGAHRVLKGGEAARALAQKAVVLQRADRSSDALSAWDQAIEEFRAEGMETEAAIARHNRGLTRIYRDELDEAEADIRLAESEFRRLGQDIRAVEAVHNLGLVRAQRGDLPSAFELLDAAQAEAGRLGAVRPQGLTDRAQLAIDAGLIDEGRALAEMAVERLEAAGNLTDVPEASLLAARACELDGDPEAATAWARRAADLFLEQGRSRWELLAELAACRAQAAAGVDVADELSRLGQSLRFAGWIPPAVEADTLAVVLHVDRGRLAEGRHLLDRLRPSARGAAPMTRLELRLAQARYATAAGELGPARRALAAAVQAQRAQTSTVGSVELRSRAGGRSDAVLGAGVELALTSGDAQVALWTAEAVRSPAPVPVHEDPDTAELLDDLRDVNRRIAQARAERAGEVAEVNRLRRRQAAMEELLRRRTRHLAPDRLRPARPARVDLGRLRRGFRGFPLIEYVTAGDRLYAVVAADGEVTMTDVAEVSDIRRVVAGLRLSLHIAATADHFSEAETASLGRVASSAGELLFDPLGLGTPTRAVIVADRTLASFPWPLIPALAGTELSSAPSGSWWLDRSDRGGSQIADGGEPRVLLVAGPGLHHAEDEVEAIAGIWPDAEILSGPEATVGRVAKAAGAADIVHIAAHASHRGDHPLLSGVRLWDGHLTGYELSTRHIPARLMVLSCCETGMSENAGGIGLSRLLTEQSGVATAVASVSPLADRSAGPLMTDLHRRLASGAQPARALAEARLALGGPLRFPTGAGLVCYGL